MPSKKAAADKEEVVKAKKGLPEGFTTASFLSKAPTLTCTIKWPSSSGADEEEEIEFNLDPKEFNTGSIGWQGNIKANVDVNVAGNKKKAEMVKVACNFGINATIPGTKPKKTKEKAVASVSEEEEEEEEEEPPKKKAKTASTSNKGASTSKANDKEKEKTASKSKKAKK